jgi:hypothetical protein
MNPTQAGAAALVLAVPYAAGAPLLPTGAGAVAADVHVPVLCIRASDEETAPPRPARGDSLFFGRVRDETCPISTEAFAKTAIAVSQAGQGAGLPRCRLIHFALSVES